jgi:uncharacterized protein
MTSERPRDALGRPLPPGADPTLEAEPVADVTTLTDAEVWATAVAYLDRGLPFHAHEVFEQRWRAAPAQERDAWRALAQWGAAMTHAARGNPEGARRLAARALETLRSAPRIPEGIPEDRVRRACEQLVSEQRGAATD